MKTAWDGLEQKIEQTHEIVSREDADGGKRVYVSSRTLGQVEQIHRATVLNGYRQGVAPPTSLGKSSGRNLGS